jgi:hypothetical protein
MDEAVDQLARMAKEWNAVLASSTDDQEVLADWERSIDSMRREAAFLRDQGRRSRGQGERPGPI